MAGKNSSGKYRIRGRKRPPFRLFLVFLPLLFLLLPLLLFSLSLPPLLFFPRLAPHRGPQLQKLDMKFGCYLIAENE